MQVTFLSPAGRDDAFFGPMIRVMENTARRLGIELEVVSCDRDPRFFRQRGFEVLARQSLPEYLILVNENEAGVELLPEAAHKGIRILTLSQGFSSADAFTLGRPREKHATWLGELLPDDRRAGTQLAEILIAKARDQGLVAEDGLIHMIGVSGPFTIASVLRLNGLRKAVADADDVELEELAPAGWDRERAYSVVGDMLTRYPRTAIVWAANDTMALGASRAVADHGATPGEEILIGGVDWAEFVPEKIRRNQLTASMGGHFFDGAWALVLLYDHHHGHDFSRLAMKSRLIAMTRANVEHYADLLAPTFWDRFDFSRFSRTLHPQVGELEISADALF